MPIEVELPDGSVAEFPDGTSRAVMKSAIQKRFAPPLTEGQKQEAAVKSGADRPDYRPPSMFGDRFQRLSDQLSDPIGLQDEIVGAGQFLRKLVTSGGSLDEAGKAYSDAAERIRAERRVARDENGIAPDIIGGFGTAGSVGRAIQAAPTFIRGVAQSARAGATAGAATGFAQGEGGVGNRLLGGAEGGAIGAVAGPVIGNVLLPAAARTIGGIRDAAHYAVNAVRSARNPQQAAIDTVADRIVAAGTTPDAIRARVGPQSPTPMNIIDLTKEVAGEGAAAPVTRLGRAAYSIAGDEAGESAERLLSRQATQSGRVSNIVQRSVANPTQRALGGNTAGDFEATRAAGLQRIRDEAAPAYRQFYAEPPMDPLQLQDLLGDPVFRGAVQHAQRQARAEAIRQNQAAVRAGRAPVEVPDLNPESVRFTPQTLDYTQRQLRLASEGHANDPNRAAHARDLREIFLDRIEDQYPTFRGIRERYATGMGEFGAEGALEAGAQLTTKMGAPAREALRDFDRFTPAQQELFRLGYARKLMDMAANPQIGGSVAHQFNSPAVREIVERLYPRSNPTLWRQGQEMLRGLRREGITTRTKNDMLSGARTAELSSDMNRMTEGARAAADALSGRYGQLLNNLSTRLTTQIGRRGAREVADILTQTDPAQLGATLDRLARSARTTQQRQAYVTAIRELRALNIPGVSLVTGETAGRSNAQKPEITITRPAHWDK